MDFMGQIMAGFPASTPSLIDRASSEQLDRIIALGEKSDERSFARSRQIINMTTLICLAVLGCLVVLCWMFLYFKETEALRQIVTLLVGLVGGASGGFIGGRASVDRSST